MREREEKKGKTSFSLHTHTPYPQNFILITTPPPGLNKPTFFFSSNFFFYLARATIRDVPVAFHRASWMHLSSEGSTYILRLGLSESGDPSFRKRRFGRGGGRLPSYQSRRSWDLKRGPIIGVKMSIGRICWEVGPGSRKLCSGLLVCVCVWVTPLPRKKKPPNATKVRLEEQRFLLWSGRQLSFPSSVHSKPIYNFSAGRNARTSDYIHTALHLTVKKSFLALEGHCKALLSFAIHKVSTRCRYLKTSEKTWWVHACFGRIVKHSKSSYKGQTYWYAFFHGHQMCCFSYKKRMSRECIPI